MANFAEDLAYWYLRLNGFFLVRSFVVHRPDLAYKADIDLLALRPRHVYEEFGGQPFDWDPVFQQWGLAPSTDTADWERIIGLIVEVKCGNFSATGKRGIQQGFFSLLRITEAVGRIGLVPSGEREAVCRQLWTKRTLTDPAGAWVLGKLLVYEPSLAPDLTDQPVLTRSIPQIEQFIRERLERYHEAKAPAFEMFPNEIIQHFLRS